MHHGRNGKKILITGGLGCLGLNLGLFLKKLNYEILITSSRPKEELGIYQDFKVLTCQLDDKSRLREICHNIDFVIHLATLSHQKSALDPKKAHIVNVEGTRNLIEVCIEKKVKKFIYFSTAHVYSADESIINEDSKVQPESVYAHTHKLAEDIVQIYTKDKIQSFILRLSNVVGIPKGASENSDCWRLFVNDICNQAISKKLITINSNVNVERDFIAISDLSKYIEFFLKTKKKHTSSIFNIGSGVSFKLTEIAKLVKNLCEENLDFSPDIITQFCNKSEFSKLNYKVEKIINFSGIEPKRNIDYEILKILKHFDMLNHNNNS